MVRKKIGRSDSDKTNGWEENSTTIDHPDDITIMPIGLSMPNGVGVWMEGQMG
jgi:hypothetical protein